MFSVLYPTPGQDGFLWGSLLSRDGMGWGGDRLCAGVYVASLITLEHSGERDTHLFQLGNNKKRKQDQAGLMLLVSLAVPSKPNTYILGL